jgi:hypothetical protein
MSVHINERSIRRYVQEFVVPGTGMLVNTTANGGSILHYTGTSNKFRYQGVLVPLSDL